MLRLLALAALTYAQNSSRIEYNVLIVGDVHDDLAAIDELRSRLGRQSRKYHLLLCTGDLTTMPHGNVDGSAKPEATPHTNAFVRKASEAARALATLAPLVYFVPGALDPLGLYEADARLPPGQPRNAHNVVEKVTSALWLAGWGGATMPFERDAHGKRRAANESTAHPWDGGWTQFPFDEREAQRRQQPWRRKVTKVPENDAVILLTHAGPDGSGTSLVTAQDADSAEPCREPSRHRADAVTGTTLKFDFHAGVERPADVRAQPLHAGSIALGEFLRQKATQQRVVLHAHGRAHAALGVARFGSAVVVNPGSLRYTRTYASVTLEERRIGGRTEWRVTRAAVADISDSSNDVDVTVTSPHLAALALSMIVFLLVALAASCARPSRRVPAPPVAFAPKTPKSPQVGRVSSV